MHDADDRAAVVHEPDRHADRVEAVHEVRGAVERVDEPFGVGARRRPPLRRAPGCRCARRGVSPHRGLAREVGFADPVARCLLPRPRAARRSAQRPLRHRRRRRRVPRPASASRSRARDRARSCDRPFAARRRARCVPAATMRRRAVGIVRHERLAVRVEHGRAGFHAREDPAEVVPRAHRAAGVDVRVEPAGRDLAERERTARERAVLLPAGAAWSVTPPR